jgi:hypothetical protein
MDDLRAFCMTPSVNIDELSSGYQQLIGLLHVRATSLPEEWVRFDDNQLTDFWHRCLFRGMGRLLLHHVGRRLWDVDQV